MFVLSFLLWTAFSSSLTLTIDLIFVDEVIFVPTCGSKDALDANCFDGELSAID